MRKLYFVLLLITVFKFTSLSQNIGIGTNTPQPSAVLEIADSSRGILIPRMTMTQRNAIQNPAEGLMVFQTDGSKGFWYWDENEWKNLSNSSKPMSLGVRIGYGQSGIWTCPIGVSEITVELWGGGGGGQQNCPTPGANGGAGGYLKSYYNVLPGRSYSVIVGAGGSTPPFQGDFVNCQYNATRGPGGNGGVSSFDNVLIAQGGGGGANGVNGANGTVINWQYASNGTSGNVSYIPNSWVQNPPTGLAAGGVGTNYCGYSFLGCGSTPGQNGYCIISY